MQLKNIIFIGVVVFFTNCDPGMAGDLKVFNESDKALTIKYCNARLDNACDTSTLTIQPYSDGTLKIFQKNGKAKKFDCCPCEIAILTFKSILGPIKKDANDKNNWEIPDKSKLKNNGKTPVKCEFHVTQSDL